MSENFFSRLSARMIPRRPRHDDSGLPKNQMYGEIYRDKPSSLAIYKYDETGDLIIGENNRPIFDIEPYLENTQIKTRWVDAIDADHIPDIFEPGLVIHFKFLENQPKIVAEGNHRFFLCVRSGEVEYLAYLIVLESREEMDVRFPFMKNRKDPMDLVHILFLKLSKAKRKKNPKEHHQVESAMGDHYAVGLDAVLERVNCCIELTPETKGRHLIDAAATIKGVHKNFGDDDTEFGLSILVRAYNGAHGSLHAVMFTKMIEFVHWVGINAPLFDPEAMILGLQELYPNPIEILRIIHVAYAETVGERAEVRKQVIWDKSREIFENALEKGWEITDSKPAD